MKDCPEIWDDCDISEYSIAKHLYILFKDVLRYNTTTKHGVWEYKKNEEWLNKNTSHMLRHLFQCEGKDSILKRTLYWQTLENHDKHKTEWQCMRLIQINLMIQREDSYKKIIKEAKQLFDDLNIEKDGI